MNKFTHAITRTPCDHYAQGISHGRLGKADAELAKRQHAGYIAALEKAGLNVSVLAPDNQFPDSCFVEDPAIVTDKMAVLTSPGAPTRKGEEGKIAEAVQAFYGVHVERISTPGTLEGGDICQAQNHFLIGISNRTNEEGARQLGDIVSKYGFTYSFVDIRPIRTVLHLKTAISYLGDETMIVFPEIADHPALMQYQKIVVDEDESYAANCIRVNDLVLVPQGFAKTTMKLEAAGFNVLSVAVSEFEKQDGGLSCLSLRIPPLLELKVES